MAESFLLTQWAVCGIAAAAARFVPVPLLDDAIRQRATRVAVARTLRAHGSRVPAEQLEPLWAEPEAEGRSSWLGRRVRRATRKLLLYPVRKYAAVFGAVRGVPTDVMRVVLLARTVDRRLDRGELRDAARVPDEARALRTAVEEAVAGMDLRLLVAALADGLSGTRGLSRAAVGFARRRFAGGDAGADAGADADLAPDAPVAESAERVAEALRRPEVAQLLDRFDAEVDRRLAPAG